LRSDPTRLGVGSSQQIENAIRLDVNLSLPHTIRVFLLDCLRAPILAVLRAPVREMGSLRATLLARVLDFRNRTGPIFLV